MLVGAHQIDDRLPDGFHLVTERNAQQFGIALHARPVALKREWKTLINAQSGENAPARQQTYLPGRKARFFQGKNAVIVKNQVIHQIGELRGRANRFAARSASLTSQNPARAITIRCAR